MAEWPDEVYGEPEIHSFLVRIWLEPNGTATVSPTWQGRIVALGDGRQQSFRDLQEISEFIRTHLSTGGIP